MIGLCVCTHIYTVYIIYIHIPDWAGNNGASALNGCCSTLAAGSGGAEWAALQERRNLQRSPAGMCSLEPLDPGELSDAVQPQFACVRQQKKMRCGDYKTKTAGVDTDTERLYVHTRTNTHTWYQEYALSAGLMRMVMILALGSSAAALFGTASVSK